MPEVEMIEPQEVKIIEDVGYYYLPIWKSQPDGKGLYYSSSIFSKFADADNYLKEYAEYKFCQKILKIRI